jgi:aspartyl-tRNA(Asn)/glutamyl-tRNA(Gln) amidotransferase subunit A
MLNQLTVSQAAKKLAAKEISSAELTQDCINRIESTETKIHALLAKDFDVAFAQAKEADKKIAKGEIASPLFGIPATIKDVLLTKNLETTAASNMLRNYKPVFDATSVKKLKDAGAIILAKNNCDAWAHGGSTENSDFGPSKNPADLERVPGGSSGGSAASVAADQCIYSIGTDTGGSIRQPAAFCGVVGLKPTYGRVSRYGAISMGSSLDTIGPITKTVEDAALVLQAIAGHDDHDATTPNVPVGDYLGALKKAPGTFRVGVPKQIYDKLNDEMKKSFDDSLNHLKNLGAQIEEINMQYLDFGIATYYIIMPSEVSSNLGRYDGIRYGYSAKEAVDLIDTYFKSRSKGFGAEAKRRIMIGTYVLSAGYYDAYYKQAMKVRTLIKNEFEDYFQKFDLIAMPTTPTPAFKLGEKTDDPLQMYLEDIFTVTINIAGVPAISVPSGRVNGLPVGLQLISRQFGEETLLSAANAFEQSINFQKKLVI